MAGAVLERRRCAWVGAGLSDISGVQVAAWTKSLHAHGLAPATVPNFDLTGYAAVNVSVQSCFIPVINISFPVIVVPVNFSAWDDEPIHSDAVVEKL